MFILEDNKKIIGSVAVYGNEIDDLIVAKSHQRRGYGERLLKFAVSYLQKIRSPLSAFTSLTGIREPLKCI
ncbi:GNAT family N-acetyltransferase [Blautia sp. RD014234]|nr:GNAT family N-acetyltransferase [Blautia parvula]